MTENARGDINVSNMTNTPILIASTATPVASTSSYVSLFGGPQQIAAPGTKILVDLFEQNTNAILYQIKGGPTATNLHTLVTDLPLAKNADAYEVVSDPFLYVDVLVKDAVGGTHGSIIGYLKRG